MSSESSKGWEKLDELSITSLEETLTKVLERNKRRIILSNEHLTHCPNDQKDLPLQGGFSTYSHFRENKIYEVVQCPECKCVVYRIPTPETLEKYNNLQQIPFAGINKN